MTDVHISPTSGTVGPDEEPGPRFARSIPDPVFGAAEESLRRIEAIAWQAFEDGKPSPTDPTTPSRVLLIVATDDAGTTQLMQQAARVYEDAGIEIDRLDSGALAPAEIAQRWMLAHAVHIVTGPKADALDRMLDLLQREHLQGRAYGLMVHGIAPGIERVRRTLSDRLDAMGLIDAGAQSRLDRFIGYYQPYAQSHDGLDRDQPLLAESRNVARAVANAVVEIREGRLSEPDLLVARSRAVSI